MKRKFCSLLAMMMIALMSRTAAASSLEIANVGVMDFGTNVVVRAEVNKANNAMCYYLLAKDGVAWRTLRLNEAKVDECKDGKWLEEMIQAMQDGMQSMAKTKEAKEILDLKVVQIPGEPSGQKMAVVSANFGTYLVIDKMGMILVQGKTNNKRLSWSCPNSDFKYWEPVLNKVMTVMQVQ